MLIKDLPCQNMLDLYQAVGVTVCSEEQILSFLAKPSAKKPLIISQIFIHRQGIFNKANYTRFNASKIPKNDDTMNAICRLYGKCTIPPTHPAIRVIKIFKHNYRVLLLLSQLQNPHFGLLIN